MKARITVLNIGVERAVAGCRQNGERADRMRAIGTNPRG
jgi:hypothetical protein